MCTSWCPAVASVPTARSGCRSKRTNCFIRCQPSELYKKLFVEELRKAGLYEQLPYGVLKFDWVVNIKPVGDGEAVLKYLAPYVYRVAITDNRIVSVTTTKWSTGSNRRASSGIETRRLSGEAVRPGVCPAHPATGIPERFVTTAS